MRRRGQGRNCKTKSLQEPKSSRLFWLAALLVAGLAAAVYSNSLTGEFVFDDNVVVLGDPRIREPIVEAWRLFLPTADGAPYRPFRAVSYLIDYNIGGLDPKVFHTANLIYHILGAWLALAVALRLTGSLGAALAAAALFAVHPVQADGVSYMSGRSDVLSGALFFLTLACYLRYRERGSRGWLAVAMGFEVLALMTKEVAAVLVPALLLVDVFRSDEPGISRRLRSVLGRNWRAYLLAGTLCLLTMSIYSREPIVSHATGTPWYGGSAAANFATVARIWIYYLRLLFYPDRLIADYQGWFRLSHSLFEAQALASLAALACLLAASVRLLGKGSVVGFGLAWFALTLLPVSHIIPYHELMAEHYLYLPSFGIALIAGHCLAKLGAGPARRKALAVALAATVVAALGVRTFIRNRDWQTSLGFYTALTRDNPRAVRGHLGMAVTLLKQGLSQPAVRELKEALELSSDDPRTLLGLGIAVHRIGWRNEAEKRYKSALAKRPDYPQALNNLALLYIEEGRYEEAKPLLEKAQAVTRGGDATVLATFGLFYELQGQPTEALPYYREAFRLRPDRRLLREKIERLSLGEEAPNAGGRQEEAGEQPRAGIP